ncbi:MAG: hypothetical protein FWD46_04960 [Cystobacterineae bacterium]|nr:hypothetical protein [Cystobacterineae bacterium]
MKQQMSLWQVIEALAEQIPFSKQKVESVLGTQLTETEEGGNDLFQFFESPPLPLADGVVISNIDLRLKRGGGHPGFLVLEVGGVCLRLEQIRKKYTQLSIRELPRGRSLEEETSFSQMLPWGQLSFGFKERNRECLASIAFEPKK